MTAPEMQFTRLALSEVPWTELERLRDRTVFQGRAWLRFLEESQHGEPVVAVARDREGDCAYLTGLLVRRWGLRMFGAPLKGWTTVSMGFNRLRPVDSRRLLETAVGFAFGQLACRHLEIVDPGLDSTAAAVRGSMAQTWKTRIVDLTRDEEDLFRGFSSACRRAIRKSLRVGVKIEPATDADFADDYYDQLEAVFARQDLVPTYPRERVTALIRHLLPTGELLLLRAIAASGRCIATGIFPGNGNQACFWGGASWRDEVHQRPNEALMWQAMLHWKQRGARSFDLGGAAGYKRKFGGELIAVPRFLASRPAGLLEIRRLLARAYRLRQRLLGRLTSAKPFGRSLR